MGIVTGYLSQLVSSGIKLLVGGSAVSSSNPLPVMSPLVTASDGVNLPINSLEQTLFYTAGNLTSITVTYNGVVYIQTLTYTSGVLTAISKWVAQ